MGRRGGGGGGCGTSTEMNPEQTLCLVMEKGPLEGQELKFSPGARIQIGRILRGNTLAVKDAGVSTKHFSITFGADVGGWTISDLDSSNGTHLNSDTLQPFAQVRLSNGDIIKIGEYTSIKVRIAEEESKVVMGKPPRAPKMAVETESVAEKLRPGRGRVSKKEEIIDVEAESVAEKLQPRRGRPSKKEDIIDVEAESVAEKLRPRRGRSSKKEEIVDVEAESVAEKLRPRRGRPSKKEVSVDEEAEVVEVVETRRTTRARSKEVIPVEITSTRGTRSAKRDVSVEEPVTRKGSRKNTRQAANEADIVEEEMLGSEIEESKEVEEDYIDIPGNLENANTKREGNYEKPVTKGARSGKNTRRTANEVQKVVEEKLGLEIEESKEVEEEKLGLEIEETKEVEEERLGLEVDESKEVEEEKLGMEVEESKEVEEEKLDMEVEESKGVEEEKLGMETEESKEVEENLMAEKENVGNVEKAGDSGTRAVDFKELAMEKMTIGEFVHYLDEYFPQRILAETEGLISKMKDRGRRVHEYLLEQEKAKGKTVG